MKYISKRFIKVGVIGVMLWLSGCATPIPPKQVNPYFGYVFCKSLENDRKVNRWELDAQIEKYAEQIAAAEFSKRRHPATPNRSSKKVSDWQGYADFLKEPVMITEDHWINSAVGLKKKELIRIEDYWKGNAGSMEIDGAATHTKWREHLDATEQILSAYKTNQKIASNNCKKYLARKDYANAINELQTLKLYGDIGTLESDVRDEAAGYFESTLEKELEDAGKEDNELQETKLKTIYDRIRSDIRMSEREKAFTGVLSATIEKLGNNWRRRIESLGEDGRYWEAYELALKKFADIRQFEPHRTKLVKSINDGYSELLADAIKHYTDAAGKFYGQDRFGMAFIYCCMAMEMYDFCAIADVQPNEQASRWNRNVMALRDDLESSVKEFLSRRLIIYDFESDPRDLARTLRNLSMQRYGTSGNDLVWALDVVNEKLLSPDTLPPPEPSELDYLVSGTVGQYTINDRPEIRTQEEHARIRTNQIKKKKNENYKDKNLKLHEHKYVIEQKVDMYPAYVVERSKDIKLDINISYDYRNFKDRNLLYMDTLNRSRLEPSTKVWVKYRTYGDPQINADTLIYPPTTQNIPTDPLPRDQTSMLSDNDEIFDNVDQIILKDLMPGLDALLGRYPVEIVTEGYGGSRAASETPENECDALGLAMLYCSKLSESAAADHALAGKGYQWLHRKDQLKKNIKKWCESRWADSDKVVLNQLKQICEKSVELANQLDKDE